MIIRGIIFLYMALFASVAHGRCAPPYPPLPVACVKYKFDRTTSVKSKNWSQLELEASDFIENCGEKNGIDKLSEVYGIWALTYRKRNMHKNAYEVSKRGILRYYDGPDCHLEKALALISLNNFKEVQLELDNAEMLVNQAIMQNKLYHPEYNEQNKNRYRNILEQIKIIRKKYNYSKHSEKQN